MLPYRERARARKRRLDDAAAAIVARCAELGDVKAVYAFGSYGRCEVGPESDLDVLIVRDTVRKRSQRDDDIREGIRVPVALDIIVVTPSEFRDTLPTTSMGRTILRDVRRLDAS